MPNDSFKAQQEAHTAVVIEQLAKDLFDAKREADSEFRASFDGLSDEMKARYKRVAKYIWLRYRLERIEAL